MSESVPLTREPITLKREGDSTTLRQLVPDDAGIYYELITQDLDHLRQYDDRITEKYPNAESFKNSVLHPINPNTYRFGIWDAQVLVGGTNLTVVNDKAEIGFWTGVQHTGHGYARRGQGLLIDFAFDTLALDEVYCEIMVDNEASKHLVEELGFEISEEFVEEDNTHMLRYTLKKSIQ